MHDPRSMRWWWVVVPIGLSALVLFEAVPRARESELRLGQTYYAAFCSECHGASGRGDGPSARILRTKPIDLTRLRDRNDGRFDARMIEELIAGSKKPEAHAGEMPRWGELLAPSDDRSTDSKMIAAKRIGMVAAYLETLQAKTTSVAPAAGRTKR